MDQTAITLCRENSLPLIVLNIHRPGAVAARRSRRARRHPRPMSTIPADPQGLRAPRWTRRSRARKQRVLVDSQRARRRRSMLDTVRVELYGQSMPLNQVASVSAPGAAAPHRHAVRQGADARRSRRRSATPTSGSTRRAQGGVIRVPLPAMNEERRKELVKVVHKLRRGRADRGAARAHARRATRSRSSTRCPRTT